MLIMVILFATLIGCGGGGGGSTKSAPPGEVITPTSPDETPVIEPDPVPEPEVRALSDGVLVELGQDETALIEQVNKEQLDGTGLSIDIDARAVDFNKLGVYTLPYSLKDNAGVVTSTNKLDVIVTHKRCSDSCSSGCIKLSTNELSCANPSSKVNGVSIDASLTTCVAPCGVFVSASGLSGFKTKRPFHDLSYQWQFGDPTSIFQSLAEDFKFGRSADHAQGPDTAHVYAEPGSYTIVLQVGEKSSGKHGITTKVITVQDPDDVFSADKTLCVSRASNFGGCPSGAQRFTDIDLALDEFKVAGPKRLLLKAGETFVPQTDNRGQVVVLSGSNYNQRQVNRFGNGSNPVISVVTAASKIFVFEKLDSVQIANIDFQGDYDAATGYGESWACHLVDPKETTNLTFYRNSVSGLGGTTYAAAGGNLFYVDNVVTNWHDIGFFTSGRDVDGDGLSGTNLSISAFDGRVPAQEPTEFPQNTAFIGNSIKQKVDAIMNMGGKGGDAPRASDHGPIRIAGAYGLVISRNDMLSTAGWSSVPQPTIRYNTSGPMFHSGVINENRLEGGNWNISASPANAAIKANLGDLIIERNIFKGGDSSRVMIAMSYGGSTIRNNYFLLPSSTEISDAEQYRAMIELGMQDTTAENAAVPVFIGGNTMINLYEKISVDYSPILDRWHVGNFYLPHVEVDDLNYSPYTSDMLYTIDPQLDELLSPQSSEFEGMAKGDDKLFDTIWGNPRAEESNPGVD